MDPFGVVGTAIAGKYRVDRMIGEGGFGVVYAGLHLVVGNAVAIKLMKPIGGPDDRARSADAFLREARVLFDLAHPSIVRLYDVGVTPTRLGEVPYVVLELIAGTSLADEVRRRQRGEAPPFAAHEVFAIFDSVLDGLAVAHARGVVHRDLKPSNVMLTRAASGAISAKVLDFGTARAGAPAASGGPGSFTPLYAAPEQWDARFGPTGAPTDVFAVGLLLAETTLLSPALGGDGMAQIAGAAMDPSRRPSLAARRGDLPRDLDPIFLRATRPAPNERFSDAGQMRAALRAAFGAAPSQPAAGAAPLAFTVAPPQTYAPPPPMPPPGAMIPVGPPPRGIVTTNAPMQHTMAPSQVASGPHAVSVVALIVGLCALGAVLAFSVVLVLYLRQPEDPARVATGPAPTAAPTAPAAPGASPKDPIHVVPSPPTPTPAPTHPGPTPKPAADYQIVIGVEMANAFNPDELKTLATSHKSELAACYAKTLTRQPTFTGTAEVTVFNTLGAQDCKFSERKDDEVDVMCGCLKATISGWRIPTPHNAWGSALFIYKIFFAP